MRVGDELAFVPSEVALRVAATPRAARVAGAPAALRGIALFEGAVVPLVAVGDTDGVMLVCELGDGRGERIGLVGIDVVASGLFDVDPADPARVQHDGRWVQELHVADVVALVQGTRWVARA